MEFSQELKVKIDTMTKEQAEIFLVFLETEIERHAWDIDNAVALKKQVKGLFGL